MVSGMRTRILLSLVLSVAAITCQACSPFDLDLLPRAFVPIANLLNNFWDDPNAGSRQPMLATSVQPGPGKVTTDFAGNLDEIIAALAQPDGKIVAAGVANTAPGENEFGLVRYNPNGTLDATFGAGGKVMTRFYAPGGADGQGCFALALQSDGKIVAAGTASANAFSFNQYDFALARYNSDGSLDSAFGTGGLVLTNIQGTALADAAMAVAVQSDGKILAAGMTGTISDGPYSFALARYNANGALDSGYGTGGIVVTSFFNDTDIASSLVIQSDGKAVAGGWAYNGTDHSYDFALARYNLNGTLDTSFGVGGKVVTDFSSGTQGNPLDDAIISLALQPDGKIVAAGIGEPHRTTSSSDFAVARYNPDGSLDATFGAGGKVSTDFDGTVDMANSVALQPDGKIVVAGIADGYLRNLFSPSLTVFGVPTNSTTASDIAIARYNANGSLDLGFGTSGKSQTDFFGSLDAANKVLVLPDGNLLVLGFAQTTPYTASQGQDFRNTDFASVEYLGHVLQRRKLNDFDGDGKADLAVFRPSAGAWYFQNSFDNSFRGVLFGVGSDLPVPGDYDGDGKADIAVFRPSSGVWYILQSSDNAFRALQFGLSGDKPVPDDYDGDGITDIAVFRPSQGAWYLLRSNLGFAAVSFGLGTDLPVNGDYDGDGKSDVAVYRPSSGVWYRLNSSNGAFSATLFGTPEDKPAVGDYDGDGIFDLAVFRPSTKTWYLLQSHNGLAATQFGLETDLPVPADYDGDGKTDIAVFRPSTGAWYLAQTTNGFGAFQFGANGDLPIPAAR